MQGPHPSEYEGSLWPEGIDHADFKPNTSSGYRTFDSDLAKGKFPTDTVMIPYDPETGYFSGRFDTSRQVATQIMGSPQFYEGVGYYAGSEAADQYSSYSEDDSYSASYFQYSED